MIDIVMHMSISVVIFFQFQIAKDICNIICTGILIKFLQHNLYWNIVHVECFGKVKPLLDLLYGSWKNFFFLRISTLFATFGNASKGVGKFPSGR